MYRCGLKKKKENTNYPFIYSELLQSKKTSEAQSQIKDLEDKINKQNSAVILMTIISDVRI